MLTTRQMKLLMISTVASFSLAGCNDGVGDRGVGCPTLKSYSLAEQKRAAAEIRSNPNGELAKMVRDYGLMRKACRI